MDSYSSVDEIKFNSRYLYPVAKVLDGLPIMSEETVLGEGKKEDVVSLVKVFVNNNFNFHNVLSVYRNSASYRLFRRHPNNSFYSLPTIRKDLVLVDPLKIPVKFRLDDAGSGDVDFRVIHFKNSDLFICLSIELPREVTTLTPSTYIHELTHTQLVNRNSVKYSFNDELLSILMEFLFIIEHQKDKDVYESDKRLRTKDFIYRTGVLAAFDTKMINYDSGVKDESLKYSVSTLQAFHLVMLYEAGDSVYKREMLKNIQKILDGKIMVEDFLDMYKINLTSMLDEKKLIRFLKK